MVEINPYVGGYVWYQQASAAIYCLVDLLSCEALMLALQVPQPIGPEHRYPRFNGTYLTGNVERFIIQMNNVE